MTSAMYWTYNKYLSKSIDCECIRCGMPTFPPSFLDTTASLVVSNIFESLSSLSEPDSPIQDNTAPDVASSPIAQTKEAKSRTKKEVLNYPLRILIMNCQPIKNTSSPRATIAHLRVNKFSHWTKCCVFFHIWV